MEPGLQSTGEQGIPSMATTVIEINPEAGAVECYQRRVQELADVITSHSLRFRRIALGHLGNAADAEDAVQDALLSAWTHVDQFKGRAKMSTWLTTIVINSARMKLRRRSPQVQIALDEPCSEQNLSPADMVSDTRPDPEEVYRKRQIAETLAHATLRLSPTLRTTFRLRDVDGLSMSPLLAAHACVACGSRSAESKSPSQWSEGSAEAGLRRRLPLWANCLMPL
jgi:RNA polymerase sigma factor (sigma-70 family)